MAAKEKSDHSLDFLTKDSHPVGTGVGTNGGALDPSNAARPSPADPSG